MFQLLYAHKYSYRYLCILHMHLYLHIYSYVILRYIHNTSVNFTFVLNIDYGLVSRMMKSVGNETNVLSCVCKKKPYKFLITLSIKHKYFACTVYYIPRRSDVIN